MNQYIKIINETNRMFGTEKRKVSRKTVYILKTFPFKTAFNKESLQSMHTSEQLRVKALAQGHNNRPRL